MDRPTSVVYSDREALAVCLAVHAAPQPRILDCTYNRGRFWRGSPHTPHRMDVDPRFGIDTVADFRSMPFPDASFDVLVFDPPHVTEAGKGIVGSAGWAEMYGTHSAGLRTASIVDLFPAFLTEARRVLVPNGVVIAKIADQVHRGAYRWQARAFQNAAEVAGMTCCDLLVKVRRGGLADPKWKHVHHVRKAHCYWLVVRNGARCMGRAA